MSKKGEMYIHNENEEHEFVTLVLGTRPVPDLYTDDENDDVLFLFLMVSDDDAGEIGSWADSFHFGARLLCE